MVFVAACNAQILNHRKDQGPDWDFIDRELRRRTALWTEEGRLARDDGSLYTVDLAQLLGAAARSKDLELYRQLRSKVDAILVTGEYGAHGPLGVLVAWRSLPGRDNDASGTTEALRLAQALWQGSLNFGFDDDRELALKIVEGYGNHAYVDQGEWLIRNYYNLKTRAFAQNSFLIDYDPDFLWQLAAETQRPELSNLAERSSRVVQMAQTTSGLLHEIIQPEFLTAMPVLGSAFFSPNNFAQLSNSCTVLERSLRDHRTMAAALLEFAVERLDSLGLIYNVETGARHPRGNPGVETLGCLLRLAHHFDRPDVIEQLEGKLRWFVDNFLAEEPQPRAFLASELLHTAHTFAAEAALDLASSSGFVDSRARMPPGITTLPTVWYISPGRYLGFDGTSLAIRWLAEAWVDYGGRSVVWTANNQRSEITEAEGRPPIECQRVGHATLPATSGPSWQRAAALPKLAWILRRHWIRARRIPILHGHHVDGAWIARLVAGKTGRFINHMHTELRDELATYFPYWPTCLGRYLGARLDAEIGRGAKTYLSYHDRPGATSLGPAIPRYELERMRRYRQTPSTTPLLAYLGNDDAYQNLKELWREASQWPSWVRLRWVTHTRPRHETMRDFAQLGPRAELRWVDSVEGALKAIAPAWWGLCPRRLDAGLPYKALTYAGLGLPTLSLLPWKGLPGVHRVKRFDAIFDPATTWRKAPARVSISQLAEQSSVTLKRLETIYRRLDRCC